MTMPDIDNAVKNFGTLTRLWKQFPGGFTVVGAILAFFVGIYVGKGENSRLTTENNELRATQKEILMGSLQKDGTIRTQSIELRNTKSEAETIKTENDTLKATLIQVGEMLNEAKKPAVKILQK